MHLGLFLGAVGANMLYMYTPFEDVLQNKAVGYNTKYYFFNIQSKVNVIHKLDGH